MRDKSDSGANLHRPARPEDSHDVYEPRRKLSEPSACSTCGALYRDGRWTWGDAPFEARPTECPACRRIADGYYGGSVMIHGAFALEHREEIEHMLRNLEEREKATHPLKRIMEIVDEDDGLLVTTTDGRLARSLGAALYRAYRGELEQPQPDARGPRACTGRASEGGGREG
jgi:NMD protein affecting ribosome stability and mRNA decay